MMGRSLWQRTLLLFNVRASAALDEAEDPREVMDYAYNQQLEHARHVRRGLVEVATARRQLETQLERQRARIPELESQARRALDTGREDLARRALERKHFALAEIGALERRAAEIAADEDRLRTAEQRLATRVDAFRARRTIVTARFAAASAQANAQDTLLGLADDAGQLDLAVIRAEERTDRLQARVSAVDIAVDTFGAGPVGLEGDSLDAELRAASIARSVDDELAALRAEPTMTPTAGTKES
jgi:phage shock protein A